MQDYFSQTQSFCTPFDEVQPLIPDEFMMKISNLQTHPVEQLPDLIQKVLSDRQPNDIQLQQLSDVDLAILMKVKDKSKTKTKRPDELQKMFFKRAVKYAENQFFKKKKSKRVNTFYKHYFAEAAQKIGCSILNFYHPNKQIKSGAKTGQKSFNGTYIKLILSSPAFRLISKDYLGKFVKDSYKERKDKIKKLIQTCRRISTSQTPIPPQRTADIFMNDEDYEKKLNQQLTYEKFSPPRKLSYAKIPGIERLETYFSSPKCKIPWCDKDIQMAYKCAQDTLHEYSDHGT